MAKRLKAAAKSPAEKAKEKPTQQAAPAPSVGHNRKVTKEETARAHEMLTRLESVLETAKGKLRQAYKDLKEQGHNIGQLRAARKRLREDPIEAQMDFDDYLMYCEHLGVYDAAEQARQQRELAANAASVEAAERVNGKSARYTLADVKRLPANHHLRAAMADGLRAGLEGQPCEHGYEEGTDAAAIFEAAHKDGLEQRATAATMAPHGDGQTAEAAAQ